MRHLKLLLPIPVLIALVVVMANFFDDYYYFLLATTAFKTACFVYYLRIDRSGTPMLNSLSVSLILMGVGEYFLLADLPFGKIILIVSTIIFGILFFIRQKLKETKDSLSKIKIVIVMIFVLTDVHGVLNRDNMIPFAIGTVLLVSVYLYDRIMFDTKSPTK